MFISKTMMAALFTIALVSLLLAVNSEAGLAYAARNQVANTMTRQSSDAGNNDSSNTQSDNNGGSNGSTGDSSTVPAKDLKSLSKCQSGAAADGDLTLPELKHCYTQAFNQGQDKPENSQNSAQGNDQAQNGPEQQKSISLPEPKSTSMREGFNF